ncbi:MULTISPECIES: glycoside hydrolase family 3 protein [unclassified Lactobacillus]|uniref:glycoside hydrolase family 3 protein n=1 Tax=unclassified Lactobacillus TaxID=2620435 RepID=UPI00226A2D4C|nr:MULTISPECIES: glycoside hydrolase family 3 N-terminal domain-containing protein [unclassified Lactobacillus]MCX8720816.1 glycoside hydrolase family 3 protein [Lactobacillus sp. B4010]MCX8732985.1 glycoside hydrolase family 3 protein [Lactobacillus sp. B4015]MCX8735577.1 glycoside hydrolase family 3 protein [Lactobacillus sp. B4012]
MVNLTKKPYNLSKVQVDFVGKTVASMSTDAKIGQLFFVIGQDEEKTDLQKFVKKFQPGGIMYRPDKAQKLQREIAVSQKASKIPLLIAANLEAGGNGLITGGTWFGRPLQIAATDDAQNAYNLGAVSGYEAKQVGGNMSFAPIVDIDQNFRNPIMNVRTFGSDKDRVIKMSDAQIAGLNANHVIPVAKHFPGDGVDERDQHLVSSVNSLSADEWMESYGEIYHHLIENGLPSIMIAHIMQPAWERKLEPGIADKDLRPASTSKLLIDGLLQKELNFNGLTITDATPMIGYNAVMKRSEALVATINAGIDMILFNKDIDEDYKYVTDAVADGRIPMERVDDAVTRIIATKIAQGVMNTDNQLCEPSSPSIDLKLAEHEKLAAKVADESITLVKDRDHLLPITPDKYPRIRLVVLGDTNDGGFKEGGQVTAKFKQKLEEKGFKVTVFDRKNLNFKEVFEGGVQYEKKRFDLAFYVANVETASNQTTTRLDWIHLMAADAPWFMKDIPTVFVSTCNPYHLFDIPMVSTYINAYTGNEVTINALMRKMTGEEEFLGKNPVDPFCGKFDTRL